MIIKSMSRKSPSFGQLIEYMRDVEKSQEQYFVYHNVYGRKAADLEAEFMQNSRFVQRRKNGVYLYHEILSIKSPESLEKETQKELLRDIAYDYAKQRADACMVFGALHDDHDEHLHYHLLISANYCGQSKKHRMSKAEFDSFKKTLEAQVLAQYPQLQQSVTINRQAGEKLSQKGAEIKRRTGKTPQRDALKAKLESIFASAQDKQSFFDAMSAERLEIYARGETLGVRDLAAQRNHRLKTLGLLDRFNALSARIELDEASRASSHSSDKAAKQEEKVAEENRNDRKASDAQDNRKPESDRDTQSTQSTKKPKNNQYHRDTINPGDNRYSYSRATDAEAGGDKGSKSDPAEQARAASSSGHSNSETSAKSPEQRASANTQRTTEENAEPQSESKPAMKQKPEGMQDAVQAEAARRRAKMKARREAEANEAKDQSSHKPKQK